MDDIVFDLIFVLTLSSTLRYLWYIVLKQTQPQKNNVSAHFWIKQPIEKHTEPYKSDEKKTEYEVIPLSKRNYVACAAKYICGSQTSHLVAVYIFWRLNSMFLALTSRQVYVVNRTFVFHHKWKWTTWMELRATTIQICKKTGNTQTRHKHTRSGCDQILTWVGTCVNPCPFQACTTGRPLEQSRTVNQSSVPNFACLDVKSSYVAFCR